MAARIAALLAFAAASPAGAQHATTLVEDDLRANRRTRIDASSYEGLDAVMGGGGGFSTRQLEPIEERLRAELRRERPRATPRLLLFLYPGRVTAERLRAMSEVLVDLEVVMDPCERSVCREAVARHIEMVGRAVGKAAIVTPDYKVTFKSLTLQTVSAMRDQEIDRLVVPIADCIAAAQRPGGGVAWLDARRRADLDYEPLVMNAIQRHARERRVALAAAPTVRRSAGVVEVGLRVQSDRVRWQQQMIDAFWAAAAALRASPATPPESRIAVEIDSDLRGSRPRHFRAAGAPVGLYLDGRIDRGTLLSTYLEEVKQGKDAPMRLDFDDAEAAGRAGPGSEAPSPDDNAAVAVLAAHFPALAGCARAEVQRNRSFRGVTIGFKWLPSGRAAEVAPTAPALRGGPFARCIEQAIAGLSFPRFSGGARTVEYPIRIE